jgi:hypothetical protein
VGAPLRTSGAHHDDPLAAAELAEATRDAVHQLLSGQG